MSAPDWRMASRLAATASAVPRYHSRGRPRATNGCRMRMPPTLRSRSQGRPAPMWSFSERGAYCVRTTTLVMPELTQLQSVKSMMRYLPPNGTAGLARTPDRSERRSPSPPARTTANVRLTRSMLHLRAGPPRPSPPARDHRGSPTSPKVLAVSDPSGQARPLHRLATMPPRTCGHRGWLRTLMDPAVGHACLARRGWESRTWRLPRRSGGRPRVPGRRARSRPSSPRRCCSLPS